MTISWLQAIILGIFACLSSMPGMGGTTIGNYTLGRPLVAGLVCGIVLGDIQAGVLVGAAMQVVYIALVTPGGNCISRRSCRILYRYSTGNVSIKFIRIRSCISKRYLHGNIIWSNGRNDRYSIILWNSNDQPCMAAHWMAGR